MLISRSQFSIRTRSTGCNLAEDAGGVDEPGDRTMPRLDIGDAADDGGFARHIERRRPQNRMCIRKRFRRDIDDDNRLALFRQ